MLFHLQLSQIDQGIRNILYAKRRVLLIEQLLPANPAGLGLANVSR